MCLVLFVRLSICCYDIICLSWSLGPPLFLLSVSVSRSVCLSVCLLCLAMSLSVSLSGHGNVSVLKMFISEKKKEKVFTHKTLNDYFQSN